MFSIPSTTLLLLLYCCYGDAHLRELCTDATLLYRREREQLRVTVRARLEERHDVRGCGRQLEAAEGGEHVELLVELLLIILPK